MSNQMRVRLLAHPNTDFLHTNNPFSGGKCRLEKSSALWKTKTIYIIYKFMTIKMISSEEINSRKGPG